MPAAPLNYNTLMSLADDCESSKNVAVLLLMASQQYDQRKLSNHAFAAILEKIASKVRAKG